jgi:type II secretory pathway pseudopilin PulG
MTAIGVFVAPRSLRKAQETVALKDIQTIQTAVTTYQAQFGRYPASMDELGAHTSFISAELASGAKGGYQFTLQGGPAVYTINANALESNVCSPRAFYTDQTQVVRESQGSEPASAASSAHH